MPRLARNVRSPSSSPAKKTGVNPQKFMETISLPVKRLPGPRPTGEIAVSSTIDVRRPPFSEQIPRDTVPLSESVLARRKPPIAYRVPFASARKAARPR